MGMNSLEKVTYIMIIIVCLVILCMLFLFMVCYLIKQQKRRPHSNSSRSINQEELEESTTTKDCGAKLISYLTFSKNETTKTKASNHRLVQQQKLDQTKGTTKAKTSLTELPDLLDGKLLQQQQGAFTSFFTGFKTYFYGSSSAAASVELLSSPVAQNATQTACLKSNIKKCDSSGLASTSYNHKSRRNSSIPSSNHSVKFKKQEEDEGDDTSSYDQSDLSSLSSDEAGYESMRTGSKKHSITSSYADDYSSVSYIFES